MSKPQLWNHKLAQLVQQNYSQTQQYHIRFSLHHKPSLLSGVCVLHLYAHTVFAKEKGKSPNCLGKIRERAISVSK